MPPLVPRKRLRESPPPANRNSKKTARGKAVTAPTAPRKATLYDDLDASATPQSSKNSHSILHGLGDDDGESSLTSLSDEEFEDVLPPKHDKADEDSGDDDIEFEDVEAPTVPLPDAPAPTGDLELTLIKDTRISLTNQYGDKKGPTKRERKVRHATHCVHVLLLLWHNAVRNSWLCDPEVQATMISHLPPKLWDEVDRWRKNSGLVKEPPVKKSPKGKGKEKAKGKKDDDRKARDWGAGAERLEEGAVDMSHGDPLFRLMKALTSWWKQRFRINAPGLRKWGYMALERLDRLTKASRAEEHDPLQFGERIRSLEDFRQCARSCEGSRDVGAQLFTALLRGLGMEARMVANLQSLGFGWSKYEDAEPEKDDGPTKSQRETKKAPKPPAKAKQTKRVIKAPAKTKMSTRSGKQGERKASSDSDELELEFKDTDDESVVDLKVTPRGTIAPSKVYDKDMDFPHYWTEVLSPVTNKYLPVDPIVKGVVGTNRDLIESLEPRGAKADKARQIMAYIVGFSQDGTAKDVTVRYLKRNLLPGRTKGMRMPLEKVPVYNRHGKVKRYEQFDWFKTAMSGYRRGAKLHPITEVDEMEDTTELTPAMPEKKEVKEGEETLQYYKQSKEYALARHLKREEALRPGAEPVKVFKNKAKGGKVEEEDVFLRSDVMNVKSAETWHKQGRAPLAGEQPLKRVPYRAATTNRRREIMEAEAATGQKVLQGLFSFDQTDWIIPPPIKDGIIPKNEYGNIDLFAQHMCPEGAVHVPFRGAIRVCKRLQIDYAEAVVDFEFGHRMAVPVIQGVVIAEEHHDHVMEELEKDEAERMRKEDEKRRKAALGTWRKFLMGMRIAERIRQEYGEIDESVSVFGHSKDASYTKKPLETHDEDMAGGFLPEGYEEEEDGEQPAHHTSSFFPAVDEDDDGEDGLVMEDQGSGEDKEREPETKAAEKTSGNKDPGPSRPAKPRQTAPRRSTRRRRTVVTEDDGDSDEDDEMEDAYMGSDDNE
ncbi:Fc.00g092130.m01.CDS01 [Cosmosporella sp. VM-42]